MMTKKSLSRLTGLFLTLALISTTCGWIPFTAPVTIHSTPEGAAVYKPGGEEPVGVTPFKTRVFHTDKTFEVRLDKFHNETVVLDFNVPENVYLKMRPKPVLVYTKPAAEVYPAGSDTSLGKGSVEVDVLYEDRNYIIKAADYYDKEITIGLATENPVVIALEHRPLITLSAAQDGVDIYEDGSFFAKAPVKEEILEPRSFEFRKEGYYKKSVDLTSAKTHELSYAMNVDLVPLPVIEIKATPSDAKIYLVGSDKPLGTGSLKLTVEKKTSFEVKADRYYPETFTAEAKDQLATVSLEPMPYVMIKSTPAGAEVYSGGKLLGTTPLEQLIEEETTYELRQEGYLPQTVTLDGSDLNPSIAALEEVPPTVVTNVAPTVVEAAAEAEAEEGGMNLPLIGGAAAAIIAAIIALLIKKKKKKKSA